jgi:hypothetical protein
MASGNTLVKFTAQNNVVPGDWKYLPFTSGGTHEVLVADTLTGATGGATAVVVMIVVTSGTWGGGDAAGFFILKSQSGAFESENLDEGANSNVCTIAADSSFAAGLPSDRNGHKIVTLDDTVVQFAVFADVLVRAYAGGGVTAYVHVSLASDTTNEITIGVAFERIGDQQLDVDTDSWAEMNNSAAITVPGTAGLVDIIPITFSDGADMDSVAVGEGYRLLVCGRSDLGANVDDAVGNRELHRVELKET